MSKYTHIFFDLDHTLWDFEKNSEETLLHLFDQNGLHRHGIGESATFVSLYREINVRMWEQYHRGEIRKEHLRTQRFVEALTTMGFPETLIPGRMWEQYLQICPTKTALMPGAMETLVYLKEKYSISIITNGFEGTQQMKVKHSGLDKFIDHILTSEKAGFQKPESGIFSRLLELNGAEARQTLMVGDNLEADIAGAKNAGIDQVWFNPEQQRGALAPTFEIRGLSELQALL